MPELTQTQNYVARIKADLYWIERTIEKSQLNDIDSIKVIHRLANAGYLSAQAISDLSKEMIGKK
ncbi:hypothetical protein [Atribacter laminatus]|uniref:Uncharacterized protein n=1 Tax=Atribacter laminatus TaxID=2847778 RepID=A0A7T1F1C5_ATRLM|nr:hypothetical protein [Atribacter laminatus]QPM66878.1 hypothetical protein RT761_00064 [Atribacter laminatus]